VIYTARQEITKREKAVKMHSGQIKNRVNIGERPISFDDKSVVGDWAIHTVARQRHRRALITIVERVTLFTVSMRVKKNALQS